MNILKKVVQYWESDHTGYTVTTTYDDAGMGTVVDSRGPGPFLEPLVAPSDEVHAKAVAAVRASVLAGEQSPASGADAIQRLNAEKTSAVVTSGSLLQSGSLPVVDPAIVEAVKKAQGEVAKKSGSLPDDFPYLTVLLANDPPINTYFKLSAFANDYTAILGIGDERAKEIAAAVG